VAHDTTEQRDGEPDGRVQRGARNRDAIVEALFELIETGNAAPTAEQVAQSAGVGTRTVFRHFDDMESLYAEISERLDREIAPLLAEPRPEGDLLARAADLVRRRVLVFERIAAFKRAGNQHAGRSQFLRQDHADMVRRLRADMLALLPELESGPESRRDAVEMLVSFEAWDRLRGDQRLGRERTHAALEAAVLAILRDRSA
jgi:AcrR family transcriptional regulator